MSKLELQIEGTVPATGGVTHGPVWTTIAETNTSESSEAWLIGHARALRSGFKGRKWERPCLRIVASEEDGRTLVRGWGCGKADAL